MTKKKYEDLIFFKNKKHVDKRGYFKEILQEKLLKKISFSCNVFLKKGVIRGLHLQRKFPRKYISVIKGKIYDIAIDLRKNQKHTAKNINLFLVKKIINLYTYLQDLHMDFRNGK